MRQRHLYSIILLLIASISPCASLLRAEPIQLQQINTKGYVVRIGYRDVNGIVWLGTTSGLVSLPQLQSRNPSAYHRKMAEPNMSVRGISGDSQGRMWIKTHYNTNCFYDPRKCEIVEDASAMLLQKGIKIDGEYTVVSDTLNNLWVWCDNKFYWLPRNAAKAQMIRIDKSELFRKAFVMEQKALAMSTKAIYTIGKKKWQIIKRIPLPEGYNFRDHVFMSDEGTPWIWSSNKLWHYEGGLWVMTTLNSNSDITAVSQDGDGRLWISCQSDGIFICDLRGNVLNRLQYTPGDPYGLQSNWVETLSYDDVDKVMWIAYTKGGLSLYSSKRSMPQLYKISTSASQAADLSDVLSFASAGQRKSVWIGMEGRGVWLHGSEGDKNIIGKGSATSLLSGSDGSLWAGIYQHGLVHHTANGSDRTYMEGTSPFALVEGHNGHIFAGLLGMGVWELDPATGKSIDTHLDAKYVFGLAYHKNRIYATSTGGLYVKEVGKKWEKVVDGHFYSVNIDHQDYLWLIGSEGCEGLTLIDKQGHVVDIPNDLRTAPLKSIAIDKNGNVWATTPSQLLMLRYHPRQKEPLERHTFKINAEDRQIFYNASASFVDNDGILWLGATTGYQSIDTHQLMSNSSNQKDTRGLILGAVSVNGNVLSPGELLDGRNVLEQDIVFTSELNLRHNENNLVIECFERSSDSYVTEIYYYQLKGQSDTWHPFENNTIVLTNLPPGDYRLYTRTQSSEPTLLLTIHIAPPFWLTWWAFCIYALLLAAVVCTFFRHNRNRRKYRQQLHELHLQQKQQQQMNDMKLRFFTNISHDLRTPLSLIIGPVEEMMKNDELDARSQKSMLTMVHRNAQHLLSLVNQILDFRRLEVGHEKLVLSYGDIVSFTSDVCESFYLKAEKSNVTFTFRPIVERVETMFDRDKITKIMMNLLSNAFKFTPDGGSIIVTLEVSDGNIIIAVADTGTGISDEDKPNIFERFYKVEDNTHSSLGSGIGLHIVREYVRLHNGDITVSDNDLEGTGTIFRFTIPLKKKPGEGNPTENRREQWQTEEALAEDSEAGRKDEEIQEEKAPETEASMPLVLLVDDNSDLLAYMKQSLATNFRIMTASNGMDALALMQQDIDIVVSDVMMPQMDGLELCRRAKTNIETSHIPIVLLTAKTMASDELLGLESGADDYITKPFSMDILRQRLRKLAERSRSIHERFVHEVDISPSEITVTSIDEQFISRAISIVEEHISEPDYSIEQLSEEMGVHRAHLYKKLMHLTGKSPQQFVRVLRLKRGKQLLEQSGLYVSEVAYKVGFNSPRIFSKYFKEEFGVTPKELIK